MYYNESGAFDKTPLINAMNSHSIPQQPLASDITADESSNSPLWGIFAIGAIGGIIWLVNYLDTPQKSI